MNHQVSIAAVPHPGGGYLGCAHVTALGRRFRIVRFDEKRLPFMLPSHAQTSACQAVNWLLDGLEKQLENKEKTP